jgi:hypothetical protein
MPVVAAGLLEPRRLVRADSAEPGVRRIPRAGRWRISAVRLLEPERGRAGAFELRARRADSYTNLHQFYRVFYRSCAMSPGESRRNYTPAGTSGAEPDGYLAGTKRTVAASAGGQR